MYKILALLIFMVLLIVFYPFAIAQVNISPEMGMPIPVPNVTPGPAWATDLNASLLIVDQHNHSPGQGVAIMPNGLNINSDLTFQGNNAITLRTTRYSPQLNPIPNTGSDTGEIYVSGNELYYNDVSGGNQIKLTLNGSVNGGAGSISGLPSGTASASYSGGTFIWQSATNTAANMDFRCAILRNSTANSHGDTFCPPPAMAANIAETLPTVPAAQSFMTMDSSGNMLTNIPISGGIQGSMIAPGAISITQFSTGTKIPDVIENISSVTTSYLALSTDGFLVVAANSAPTITLYNPTLSPGTSIRVLKNDTSLAALTITYGSLNTTLNTPKESVFLENDGTTWYVLFRYINSQVMSYTSSISNVGTSATQQIYSWRQGHYLGIQGSISLGTGTPNAIPTFTIGWGGGNSNVLIDQVINSPSQPNSLVGTFGSQNTPNIAGCLFIIGGVTGVVSFGAYGSGNKCTNGVNASGLGDSTNLEFNAMVPIQGWNN